MAKNTIDDPDVEKVKVVLYVKDVGFYHLTDLALKTDNEQNRYLPTHLTMNDGIFRLERVSEDGRKVYYRALF